MANLLYPRKDRHDPVRRLAHHVQDMPVFYTVKPRVYLVGGAVRDLCAGLPLGDIDVEVYGVAPTALRELLEDLFPLVIDVGVSYAVCKIRDYQGREMDVALPRREVKSGQGHKDFSVGVEPDLSFAEATARRDFTINAMLLDPQAGELIDFWGGKRDLAAKVLRAVNFEHFSEDPLRVWRGIQFAARFGLTVERKTFDLMRSMVASGELATLSSERVTEEWRKLLMAPTPSIGLSLARELNLLPGVSVVDFSPLDAAASLFVDEQTESVTRLVVQLAMYLDLIKADDAARAKFFKDFTFGSDIEAAVGHVADLARAVTSWDKKRRSGELVDAALINAARVIVKQLPAVAPQAPALYLRAQARVTGDDSGAAIAFTDLVEREKLLESAARPLMPAQDVMRVTGLAPGPELGATMKALEAARDAGDVLTRAQAIEWLKNR